MLQSPSTVHRPLTGCVAPSTKVRKSALTVDDGISAAAMGDVPMAYTAGPASEILCLGSTLTRRNFPASPGISVYALVG